VAGAEHQTTTECNNKKKSDNAKERTTAWDMGYTYMRRADVRRAKVCGVSVVHEKFEPAIL
jgi:hypothetical protein